MRVRIGQQVFDYIVEFYNVSMERHPLLSFQTVMAKEERLIKSLRHLEVCAASLKYAEIRQDRIDAGYRDYHVEGFHFGYRIEILPSGENVAVVYEVCHDTLFHA